MKKSSRILCAVLSVVMVFASFSLFACDPDGDINPNAGKVKVTFRNGTETFKEEYIDKGATVSEPDASSIANFKHWHLAVDDKSIPYNFSTPVNGNTTLVAHTVSGDAVTVTYRVDGATYLQVTVAKNYVVRAPKNHVPSKTGMLFEYWQTSTGESYGFTGAVSSDLVLDAKFAEAVTVSFDTKGGSPQPSVQTIKKNDTATKPATNPSKSGYIFRGWYIEGEDDAFNFSTPVTGSITLSAVYADSGDFDYNGTVVMASGELDGVLNPFFSTSAYDSEIHGQTQIGMLSADEKGNVDAGDHLPTVVRDFSQTTYIKTSPTAQPVINPTQTEINNLLKTEADKKNSDKFYTEYKFLIKNGIKFSNGENLTIKDVLFNLYVYLDPMYTGSSTIYSTNIVGLRKYREQNPNAGDAPNTTSGGSDSEYNSRARARRNNMGFYFNSNSSNREMYRNAEKGTELELQILNDVATIRTLFWSEIQSDWNSAASTPLVDYEIKDANGQPTGVTKKYLSGYEELEFTEAWEVFLFNNGFINATYDVDGKVDIDPSTGAKKIDYGSTRTWWKNKDDLTRAIFNFKLGILDLNESNISGNHIASGATVEYEDANGVTRVGYVDDTPGRVLPDGTTKEGNSRFPQIDLVENSAGKFVSKFRTVDPVHGSLLKGASETTEAYNTRRTSYLANKDNLYSRIIESSVLLSGIMEVALYWNSGNLAIEDWTVEEKEKELKAIEAQHGRIVPDISGITVETTKTFNGEKAGEVTLNEDHFVLNIKILGVDPKAIWNFAFTVSPMSYYSNVTNKDTSETWTNSEHGYLNFNYKGVVGGVGGIPVGEGYSDSKPIRMGFINLTGKTYFSEILNGEVTKIPVGAGAFKASDSNDSNSDSTSLPSASNFNRNGMVYFTRNNFFETTGEEITNAQFKSLRFMVLENSRILETMANGSLHYAEINATDKNITDAYSKGIDTKTIPNNGYGYVGVNANFVRNINVRKAIMIAMDTRSVSDYYGALAEIIHRPIPKDSWAYPEGATDVYPYLDEQGSINQTVQYINTLIAQSEPAYNKVNGVWERTLEDGTKDRLEYEFTIAGAETDHPAYSMFVNAKAVLDAAGFKITVRNDAQALSRLSAGLLTVWAAAWSATIDPDMYQVYHIDSTAQSVNNWGYPYLKQYGTDTEKTILSNLARKIEEGRSVNEREIRTGYYRDALNLVMDLAIEYPVYQRKNLVVFNGNRIDESSFNETVTAYAGLITKIWLLRVYP